VRGAVDVTGAGDTVMAVFTLAMACGGDALSAARLANVAGALVVLKSGTASLTSDELRHELRNRPVAEPELLEPPAMPAAARRARP
jgi:bifunctional ADP-heptose synthase (sugar kinase/adenylyltransferase)